MKSYRSRGVFVSSDRNRTSLFCVEAKPDLLARLPSRCQLFGLGLSFFALVRPTAALNGRRFLSFRSAPLRLSQLRWALGSRREQRAARDSVEHKYPG